jgi:hypothetical protein
MKDVANFVHVTGRFEAIAKNGKHGNEAMIQT